MGTTREFAEQVCSVDQGLELELGEDFELTGLGAEGTFEGDLVFVGYSIDDGPEGYESFPEELDLEGKIAVMLRFEPMDEDGDSLWNERRWSRKSTFSSKFGAL